MDTNYLEQSQNIKAQANVFLKEHSIVQILEKYGEVYFTGSYELDVMTRRDIDIVLVVSEFSFPVISQINNELNKVGFNKFWVFDNSKKGWEEDPKFIVTEASFGYYDRNIIKDNKWDLGISICEKSEKENALLLTSKVKAAIKNDPSLYDLIVRLKFELAEKHGEDVYRGKSVYDAVLDHHAKTIEEIEQLKTNEY